MSGDSAFRHVLPSKERKPLRQSWGGLGEQLLLAALILSQPFANITLLKVTICDQILSYLAGEPQVIALKNKVSAQTA